MKRIFYSGIFLTCLAFTLKGQYHTLTIPEPSNYVLEKQRLAVTDITVEYSSPRVNGRDVWNDPNIIPLDGDPIPWRAGANMNTRITFSTDVKVEGKDLKAGTYGFHILPSEDKHTLLFAHNNNQWGSYYVDVEKDITLKVDVLDTVAQFSEKLDYEFIQKSSNSIVIALEWADKRIPFEVSVDLNETVIASFRSELRGINTYRWQAWNDAARWCVDHDTNLEEALTWVNRSIEGGYRGFAADKNMTNIITKASILRRLERVDELESTIKEAMELNYSSGEANYFSMFLIRNSRNEEALTFNKEANSKFPETWYIELNYGISLYLADKKKTAAKMLDLSVNHAPDWIVERVKLIAKEVDEGTFEVN